MKAVGIGDIKKELKELEPQGLVELCLHLARYKKENKDYLNYLLFEAHDKNAYISGIKQQVDAWFSEIDREANLYYTKKSLRKILRQLVKYCRYLEDKALSAELHIYFCQALKASGVPFRNSQQILNMYEQEIKKIRIFIASLHPDLQNDFNHDLEQILLN